MSRIQQIPGFIWRMLRIPPRLAYALGLGRLLGRQILLLTSYGRRTGKPHVTPLQYHELEGAYYIGSARGSKADWYRNLQANPEVEVRVSDRRIHGVATLVEDTNQIADLLEVRLQSNPRMVGMLFRSEGFSATPDRSQLEAYASTRAFVVIRPIPTNSALKDL